jgi:hypothetical protein
VRVNRCVSELSAPRGQIVFHRGPTDSNCGAFGERRVRIGGWPKKRLYSRLNWLALSYPTAKAALAASRPSMSMRSRAACTEVASDTEEDSWR